MVQWIKVFAAETKNLSSIARIHTVGKRTIPRHCLLTSTCVNAHVQRNTHTHTHEWGRLGYMWRLHLLKKKAKPNIIKTFHENIINKGGHISIMCVHVYTRKCIHIKKAKAITVINNVYLTSSTPYRRQDSGHAFKTGTISQAIYSEGRGTIPWAGDLNCITASKLSTGSGSSTSGAVTNELIPWVSVLNPVPCCEPKQTLSL